MPVLQVAREYEGVVPHRVGSHQIFDDLPEKSSPTGRLRFRASVVVGDTFLIPKPSGFSIQIGYKINHPGFRPANRILGRSVNG